ncbi:MAG: GNAT family N-acetyltransferase [Gemmatimonadetes bacterium]|nr:GNAT family N-acetyltransferase [Gemmatimonadota bacterium]
MDESMGPGEQSPALLLRPWAESDASGLREAIDKDVAHLKPWLSWTLEEPTTLEGTRVRLREWVEQFRRGRAFRYAITPPDRPSLILGGAHLSSRVGPAAHDVGYWVRRSAVRQGVATAAVSTLAIHAFDHGGVDRLVARCDIANAASQAVARALGFRLTGSVTVQYPDGSPRPVHQFEMTSVDYRLHHAPRLRERARRVRVVTAVEGAGQEHCDDGARW